MAFAKFVQPEGLMASDPNWTDIGQFCVSLATLLVTALGLLFIWQQVKQTNTTHRIEVNNSTANSINELNQLLIVNDELLELNGESKKEVLCHLKINRFEQLWVLNNDNLLSKPAWDSAIVWVRHAMRDRDMRAVWDKNKTFYRSDFAKEIDRILDTG